MKNLLNFRNLPVCLALFFFVAACREKDAINPAPTDPETGPKYAGTYKGKEYRSTKMGGIDNYWFEHDTVPLDIEVVEWNNQVIMESDTFELDTNNEVRKPQFTITIRNDSLYRSKIEGLTLCNFWGKRE